MKLLFDENLSFKLVERLNENYPESRHVKSAAMKGAADTTIWNYCKEKSFIIVSKDTDFRERSFMKGAPPKVIWLDVGNAGTAEIATLLRDKYKRIKAFEKNKSDSILILSMPRE